MLGGYLCATSDTQVQALLRNHWVECTCLRVTESQTKNTGSHVNVRVKKLQYDTQVDRQLQMCTNHLNIMAEKTRRPKFQFGYDRMTICFFKQLVTVISQHFLHS